MRVTVRTINSLAVMVAAAATAASLIAPATASAGWSHTNLVSAGHDREGTSATRTDSITVVRLAWPGGKPAAPSATATRALVREVSNWYGKVSGGRFHLGAPRVLPVVHLAPQRRSACTSNQLFAAALKRSGLWDAKPFPDHVVIYLPCSPAGGEAGIGEEGGNTVEIFGYWEANVLAHELGHNLGLGHANTVACRKNGSPVSTGPRWVYKYDQSLLTESQFSTGCQGIEYGDPFDVMGMAWPAAMSAPELAGLGWLGRKKVFSETGTVQLVPLGSNAPGIRAAEINSKSDDPIWIEYRTATGTDSAQCRSRPDGCGVQLRYSWAATGGFGAEGPGLIDATPGTESGYEDVDDGALPVGSSLTLPNGIRVAVLAEDPATATIRVTFGAGAAQVPDAPANLTASVDENGRARLSWLRPTDNGAPITHYVVTASDGTTRRFVSLGGVTTDFAFGGLTPGTTYSFTVAAINEKGNGPSSQPASLTTPPPLDTQCQGNCTFTFPRTDDTGFTSAGLGGITLGTPCPDPGSCDAASGQQQIIAVDATMCAGSTGVANAPDAIWNFTLSLTDGTTGQLDSVTFDPSLPGAFGNIGTLTPGQCVTGELYYDGFADASWTELSYAYTSAKYSKPLTYVWNA